jgi:hypothetical protein
MMIPGNCYTVLWYCHMSAESRDCEARRDGRSLGTAIKTYPLLDSGSEDVT